MGEAVQSAAGVCGLLTELEKELGLEVSSKARGLLKAAQQSASVTLASATAAKHALVDADDGLSRAVLSVRAEAVSMCSSAKEMVRGGARAQGDVLDQVETSMNEVRAAAWRVPAYAAWARGMGHVHYSYG